MKEKQPKDNFLVAFFLPFSTYHFMKFNHFSIQVTQQFHLMVPTPSLGVLLAQTSIADVTEMMFGLMFISSMSCTDQEILDLRL